MEKYKIREICGGWALDIHWGRETIVLRFNSNENAKLVKAILKWEDAHPNQAVPYRETENSLKRVIKEFLEICGGDCAGDSSTGIPPCPFFHFPDVDSESQCELKSLLE